MNDRQREVLEWISAGCPEGVQQGFTHRTTARALQSRGLAVVRRRGGVWAATITDTGRYYLRHGRYPETDRPRRSRTPARPATEKARESPSTPARAETERDTRPSAPSTKSSRSVTEQLVADLIAAGGRLQLDTQEDRINWPQRVSAAIRHGRVPEGKLLILKPAGRWGRYVLTLEDPPEWMTTRLEPIPVADQLRSPHPALQRIDADKSLTVTAAVRRRARLILNALAVAADQRGYRVEAITAAQRQQYGRSADTGLLAFEIHGHRFMLDLTQELDRVDHVPTKTELRNQQRHEWMHIPTTDQVPSARLRLRVHLGHEHRQSVWADTKTRTLEDCLAEIMQELELRAARAEQDHQDLLRRQAERRVAWEAAMDRAREQFRQAHRAAELTEQVTRWRRSHELNEYLSELRAIVERLPDGPARDGAEDWLAWSQAYATRLDPLSGSISMPADPKPTPDDLKPFLGSLSPYGPDRVW